MAHWGLLRHKAKKPESNWENMKKGDKKQNLYHGFLQ